MKFFEYFLIGILCFAVVSGEFRPLEPNNVRKMELDSRDGETKYRLPNSTKPENYDITLSTAVDEDNFNFDGTVKIRVHVLEATSNITIHARQLTIKSIALSDPSTGTDIDLNPYVYEIVTEFLIIPAKTQLEKDKYYLLVITYTGELRTDNGGFYRSSYVDAIGVTKQVSSLHSKIISFQWISINDEILKILCFFFLLPTDIWRQHSSNRPMLVMHSHAMMSLHLRPILLFTLYMVIRTMPFPIQMVQQNHSKKIE